MNSINIKVINQLNDNYSFILYNDGEDASVIDPAESLPIIEFIKNNNLKIRDIFITHHHKDHTSGISGIIKNFPKVKIYSPSSHIENTEFVLNNKDEVESCINSFKIISTPGHTLDHIVYYDYHNRIMFCGDTLFRLGCGRVFEGSLNQMYSSLQKINDLNSDIILYCGHEYTLNNLNFLEKTLGIKNLYSDIRKKIEIDLKLYNKSIPFNLYEERSYNLFLNQESEIADLVKRELKLDGLSLFKYIREKKDNF